MPPLALFVPSSLDLVAWAGVIFASLALMGLGRLLTAGRATPEAALVAGWGAAALVLTLWGVATPMTLRLPAAVLVAFGLAAQLLPRQRLRREEWRAVGRVIVLALPLLAVMASARPSLPDTWLNLLPNAAYLYDHGFFPADARPAAHSFIAGAPYNMQLAAFLAGLVTPRFPASAMIDLNIVLQLAAGLLLARLATGRDDVAPCWSVTALGILLATALNPGFDPRYHLSDYSEASVTVTLAFSGWFAARALDRHPGGRDARLDLWLLALSLAALVNIKQESVALALGVVAAAFCLAATARGGKFHTFLALSAAAIPAATLYLAWRWYVLSHFVLGELKTLPLSQWQVSDLPIIFLNMLRTAGGRPFLFICLALVMIAGLWRLRYRRFDLASRTAAMLVGVAIFYNAALVFAYVAHFRGQMGADAHSYFRYTTHLGLLLMVAFVVLVRDWRWARFGGRWQGTVPTMLILTVLLDSLPFLTLMRFDLEVPNLRAYQLAHEAAAHISPDARLLLILPGDNGTVPPTVKGVLRYTAPRRPDVTFSVATRVQAGLAMTGYGLALLSCAPREVAGVPKGSAALLERTASGWRAKAVWQYPPVPPHARWSEVLAPAALCLGG